MGCPLGPHTRILYPLVFCPLLSVFLFGTRMYASVCTQLPLMGRTVESWRSTQSKDAICDSNRESQINTSLVASHFSPEVLGFRVGGGGYPLGGNAVRFVGKLFFGETPPVFSKALLV